MRHCFFPRNVMLAALLVATPLFAASARAQSSGVARRDGEVLEDRPYRLPTYARLSEPQRREVDQAGSRAEYDVAQRDSRFELHRVRYASDGLGVIAYTYRPARRAAGERRPVVVYARGSFLAGDLAPALAPMFRRLAMQGFIVVAPQYRGSDGGEGRDEMGGADVADVHNAIRLARGLTGADSTRVFLYGESRGGMMVYQALRDGANVRFAAVVGGFTDLDSLLDADPRSRAAASALWPTYDRDRDAIAARRSAARWADKLNAPLLLLHGGADQQVSPRQALRLAASLDARRVPYAVRIYEGAGHRLSSLTVERDETIAAWFRRWSSDSAVGRR